MAEKLLEVKSLRTSFFTAEGEVKAVDNVSYHVNKGEVIAIVGESGCGKSITQMSVMQLVQSPPGKIMGGEVLFEGKNLLEEQADARYSRCGNCHDFPRADDVAQPCDYGRKPVDGGYPRTLALV